MLSGEGAGVYIVEDGMLNGIDGKEDKFGIVEETKEAGEGIPLLEGQPVCIWPAD